MPVRDLSRQRRRMVDRDLRGRDITDERVLTAMAAVPRERFVPPDLVDRAYRDGPLPIGAGQTISQPYIVALMAQAAAIDRGDRVLEVGTGCGYGAAVLAHLAREVVSIERLPALRQRAERTLDGLGVTNVTVVGGDGSSARHSGDPFDAIVVTASAPSIPDPLVDQLVDGGRLVVPVGPRAGSQDLVLVTRSGATTTATSLCPVRFVPLVGAGGHLPD